jgi:preprotein translocase subunit SecG
MTTLLIIIHVFVSLFLIAIVLLQHGKGADIGATFGGSSQSVFGSEGPVPLLNKITTFVAIIFMGTSISLAYLSANKSTGTVMGNTTVAQPVKPVAAPLDTTPVTIPMETETAKAKDTAAPAVAAPADVAAPAAVQVEETTAAPAAVQVKETTTAPAAVQVEKKTTAPAAVQVEKKTTAPAAEENKE